MKTEFQILEESIGKAQDEFCAKNDGIMPRFLRLGTRESKILDSVSLSGKCEYWGYVFDKSKPDDITPLRVVRSKLDGEIEFCNFHKPIEECIFISEKSGEWFESDPHRPEINLSSSETNGVLDDQTINIGSQSPIVISKLYGPTCFCDIRVTIDMNSCEWVIQRYDSETHGFKEAARIQGQD